MGYNDILLPRPLKSEMLAGCDIKWVIARRAQANRLKKACVTIHYRNPMFSRDTI